VASVLNELQERDSEGRRLIPGGSCRDRTVDGFVDHVIATSCRSGARIWGTRLGEVVRVQERYA
jgi:hypothetical protein